MDLLSFLMRASELSDRALAAQFAQLWTPKRVKKGASIVEQGAHAADEIILLEGKAAARIFDAEGGDVCVGLFVGPCVVTPNIARTGAGRSLVSLEAITDVLIVRTGSAALTEAMISSEAVRDWGNGVLRDELARKGDREWCLAALAGADRLAWFRERYPGYEAIFPHFLIASFLGVTPVTLSRLRTKG